MRGKNDDKSSTANKRHHARLVSQLKKKMRAASVPYTSATVGASGVLGAEGLKTISDLDVWLKPHAFNKLKKLPGVSSGISPYGNERLEIDTPHGEIEMFTGKWEIKDKRYDNLPGSKTVLHKGVPHWTPETTLEWKKTMNRPKDQEDIGRLSKFLKKTAVIREQNGKYVLKSKDGKKTLGTHATREKALAQERAIQASKHGRRKTSSPKKKKNDPLERMRKSLNKGRALGKSDKAKKKGFARLMKAIKKPEPEENKNLPEHRPN